MDLVIDLFYKGGPFMWPLTATFLGGVTAAGLQIRWARRTRFPGLGVGVGGLLIATGLAGTAQGLFMVQEAVPHATPETAATLMFAGLSVAAVTTLVGLATAAIAAPLLAWSESRVERSVREALPAAPVSRWLRPTSAAMSAASAAALVHFAIFVAEVSAHAGVDRAAELLSRSGPSVELALAAGLIGALLAALDVATSALNGIRGLRAL